ncbi:GIY-YIG nuclease family protein [Streptomyces sp. NPDC101175]|uniref:GIY-YIG nuclease family protein n=1 Tax=Streptomyces sp. NPDC101175 TaxID=3366123 RepID=UPI003832BF74
MTEKTGRSTPGQVYVIGSAGSHSVKIGYSRTPEKRLWFLQVGSPVKLFVLAKYDGDQVLEAALHRYFRECHVRGEWFDLGSNPAESVRAAVDLGLDGMRSTTGVRAEPRVTSSSPSRLLDTPEWHMWGVNADIRFAPLPPGRAKAICAVLGIPASTPRAAAHPSEGCPDARTGRPAYLTSSDFVARESRWAARSFDERFPAASPLRGKEL